MTVDYSVGEKSLALLEGSSRSVWISVDRAEVKRVFLERVDEWLQDPVTDCPHPFILLFELFDAVSEALEGFRGKVNCYGIEDSGERALSAKHTCRIDKVFDYLEADDSAADNLHFCFNFSTKKGIQPSFITQGDFFEKAQSNYQTGGRNEVKTDFGILVFDNGPEQTVETPEVLHYASKELKTQINHSLELTNFTLGETRESIRRGLTAKIAEFAKKSTTESLVSAKYKRGAGVVAYVCAVTNRYYVCDCFRPGEQYWREDLPNQAKQKGWSYKHAICHLCTREVPDEKQFLTYVYDSTFKSTYNPWIYYRCYLALGEKFSKYGATLESQDILGKIANELQAEVDWGKWHNEKFLYLPLKKHFADRYDVQYQARPKFLKRQSFDVYIPELKLAVEYDGEQHYNPETYFARKSDFAKIQKRDEKKDQLARSNGVSVLRVRRGYSFERLVQKIEEKIPNTKSNHTVS